MSLITSLNLGFMRMTYSHWPILMNTREQPSYVNTSLTIWTVNQFGRTLQTVKQAEYELWLFLIQ